MVLAGRRLVTIEDLSNEEIEALLSLADEIACSVNQHYGLCRGKIMASLFFEPSTRTRLSFEAAMCRMGGSVISVADIGATSFTKGESIADMARVVGSYADIIVIRHPWEGAARVVADHAGVPVINAGDGGHQHPTQTLLDLYTLNKERQTIRGLNIALWGDLKYGRTVHSLVIALARFGVNIVFCPGLGLEVPGHIIEKITTEYGGKLVRYDRFGKAVKGGLFPLDAIYVTPSYPHQLALIPNVSIQVELEKGFDTIYVTRSHKERFAAAQEQEAMKQCPVVEKRLLKGKPFHKTLIVHSLPRVDELAYEPDADPRSMYSKQAAGAVPVRMAVIAILLGAKEVLIPDKESLPKVDYPAYTRQSGVRCPNPRCVSVQVTESKYLRSEFKIVNRKPLTLRCVYCEHGIEPKYVASADWHEGRVVEKKYHISHSYWGQKIKPENLIVFPSEIEAQAQGFKPSHYAEAFH